jgi:hypothetical protein
MYLMRMNLSVAIVDMIITNGTSSSSSNSTFYLADESENDEQLTCPYEEDQGGANKTGVYLISYLLINLFLFLKNSN